jgi:hypothetical protein
MVHGALLSIFACLRWMMGRADATRLYSVVAALSALFIAHGCTAVLVRTTFMWNATPSLQPLCTGRGSHPRESGQPTEQRTAAL